MVGDPPKGYPPRNRWVISIYWGLVVVINHLISPYSWGVTFAGVTCYPHWGQQVSREDALCRTDPVAFFAGIPGFCEIRPAEADVQNFITQLEWRKLSHGFPKSGKKSPGGTNKSIFGLKCDFQRGSMQPAKRVITPWVESLPNWNTTWNGVSRDGEL